MNISAADLKFTDEMEKDLIEHENIALPYGHYVDSTSGMTKPLIVLGLAVGFPLLAHLFY